MLEFGRVDVDPAVKVDRDANYADSFVSLSISNNWKFKTFDLASRYPAFIVTYRHAVRQIKRRIYLQPSGT